VCSFLLFFFFSPCFRMVVDAFGRSGKMDSDALRRKRRFSAWIQCFLYGQMITHSLVSLETDFFVFPVVELLPLHLSQVIQPDRVFSEIAGKLEAGTLFLFLPICAILKKQ
jgi:hypothetical protein